MEGLMEGINLNEWIKPELLDAGEEAEFMVLDATKQQKEDGSSPRLQIVLKPVNTDKQNVPAVYHTLWFPKASDLAWQRQSTIDKAKKFCDSIGFHPVDGRLDTPEALAEVKQKSGKAVFDVKTENGTSKNVVKRFVVAG